MGSKVGLTAAEFERARALHPGALNARPDSVFDSVTSGAHVRNQTSLCGGWRTACAQGSSPQTRCTLLRIVSMILGSTSPFIATATTVKSSPCVRYN